ncbi:MAG TPA: DUF1272 domain-containing protein [Burkholderiales bacterium]|nr:DUF1272 domain-containing protein [Burkholderiales bacterium]
MLELGLVCEPGEASPPADSTEAMICSFECTSCRIRVETVLRNVCPNCRGGLGPSPPKRLALW